MARIAVFSVVAFLLGGCVTNMNCVAVDNPNQITLSGKILEKEQLQGEASVTIPEGRTVYSPSPYSHIGVGAGVSTVSPLAGAFITSLPAQRVEPSYGDKCTETERVVENAYIYLVHAEDGKNYQVVSAFPGFQESQCVQLFLVPGENGLTGRIASGGTCQ